MLRRSLVRPRYFSEGQLSKVGVEIVDKYRIILACRECDMAWAVNVLSDGKLPKGYWHCPQGCKMPEPLSSTFALFQG
jgi:hypothetical protein